jgi:hypothetical protein
VWPDKTVLVAVAHSLAYDLGQVRRLGRLFVQADADQAFGFDVSEDGTKWQTLSFEADANAMGMLSRTRELPSIEARYVRLSPHGPGGTLALTELSVACAGDPAGAARLRVAGARSFGAGTGWLGPWWERLTGAPLVMQVQVDTVKLAVTSLAVVWGLLWMLWRARDARKKPARNMSRRVRSVADAALVALAFAGIAAYLNFGAYRFSGFVHEHDVFHYFVGAKYFPELGYEDLYTCAAVAEAESGFPERVGLRSQRDLRTNQLVSGAEVLARRSECLAKFTPARWREFTSDVRYFANSGSVESWHRVVRDHGFNASPAWTAVGRGIARWMPAADWSIGHGESARSGIVGPLDPLLLLATLALVAWAFGVRTASFVAIAFTCNPLAEFVWVGGAFLRQLWLVTLVLGLCLVQERRWVAAGALLATSALLQMFPFVCLASLGTAALFEWHRTRSPAPEVRRVLLGALATLLLAIPLSVWATGRADAWSEFATNTAKHARTPSVNLVGLPTALSFRMETRASLLFDGAAVDAFARVRAARLENLAEGRPLHWLGIALGALLLARWMRRSPSWTEATAAGLSIVPFALETSCYYTSWLAALALAGHRRPVLFVIVMALVAAELGVKRIGAEDDVAYALASGVLVVGSLCFLLVAGEPLRHRSRALLS